MITLTPAKRRLKIRSFIYGVTSSALIIVVVIISNMRQPEQNEVLIVRPAADLIVETPETPPEENSTPKVTENYSVAELLSEPNREPTNLQLEALATEVSYRMPGSSVGAGSLTNGIDTYLESLELEIQEFDVSDFDEIPRLLHKPNYRLPKSLREQGIKKVQVVVAVYISETGVPTLLGFERIPFDVLKPSVVNSISRMRFTPPRIDGKPYGGKFLLPITLN